jgi:hypothetical protein
MKITKGEYCQFSLPGRLQLVKEFGEFLGETLLGRELIQIYRIHDFYVEVRFEAAGSSLCYAEPVKNMAIVMHTLRAGGGSL